MSDEARFLSILKTSLPAALDLASQPIMWLVEAVFIGRLSAAALGGVGFALQIVMLTSTLLLTYVIGAIILINKHLGSEDQTGANHVLGQTVMSAFLISIPIGLTWYFGSPLLFRIIHEQDILGSISSSYLSGMDAGVQYLQTIAFFTPVLVTNFVSIGLVRGSGDTHLSMIVNLTMNVTNVILAPLLIYGWLGFPRLEIQGAAIAMGIAHSLGFIMTMIILRSRISVLFLSMRELTTFRGSTLKQLFQMGLPTTIEQLVWSGGQVVVTGFVAVLGISELAIHQVFLRIQAVLSMFYLGFGLSAMSHIGKRLGANEHADAERAGIMAHRMAFIFVSIILVILVVFSEPILHLFIRKEDVVMADFAFRILFVVFAIVQVPKAMNTVISGSLRGAGDIQWIMWITVFAVFIFEITLNWIGAFALHFGLLGIWTVQGLDEIIRSRLNYLRFRGGKWKSILQS